MALASRGRARRWAILVLDPRVAEAAEEQCERADGVEVHGDCQRGAPEALRVGAPKLWAVLTLGFVGRSSCRCLTIDFDVFLFIFLLGFSWSTSGSSGEGFSEGLSFPGADFR